VERPAVHVAARGPADDDGHADAPAVAALGRVGRDLVEGAGDEVDELHLDDRSMPFIDMPMAAPTIADSAIGMLTTRSGPNSSNILA